jgi:hypothetical protein
MMMSDYTLKNGEPTCEGCKSPLFCSTEGFCNIKSWENAKEKKFELCKDCKTPLYCEYVPGRGECAIDLGNALQILAMKRMEKLKMEKLKKSESINQLADELVNGDRQDVYGDPHTNHQRIADLWNAYLSGSPSDVIRPTDATVMMLLLKVARLMHSSDHKDTWVDIAGYAQVGYWCATKEVENQDDR